MSDSNRRIVPIANPQRQIEHLYQEIESKYQGKLLEPEFYVGDSTRLKGVISLLEGRTGEAKTFEYTNGTRTELESEQNTDIGKYLGERLTPQHSSGQEKIVDNVASFETELPDEELLTGYIMTGLEYRNKDVPWPLLVKAVTYSDPERSSMARVQTQEPPII